MKKNLRTRIFFCLLAALVVAILIGFLLPAYSGPSWAAQRKRQRQIVRDRVEAAGGWNVLHQQCLGLFENGKTEFFWTPIPYNVISNLPPAIAGLKPRKIEGYAAPNEPLIVRIRLFGTHSTGTRGIPYYGLWVVCSPMPETYIPTINFGGSTVTGVIQKITNSVFEVY